MQPDMRRQILRAVGLLTGLALITIASYSFIQSIHPRTNSIIHSTSTFQPSPGTSSTEIIPVPVTGSGQHPVYLPLIDNPQPAPHPIPPSILSGDPVLVGAGDVARCNAIGDEATADLIKNIPGTVMMIGDAAYDSGTAANFAQCYDPTWGQFKDRTRPAVGNHEYMTSGASAYQAYFGAAAGPAGKFYYSYDLGAWHVVVLNSECAKVPGGCTPGSAQESWLKQDLAAHPNQCTLAYFHEPLYSSGEHGNNAQMKTFWQDLYSAGVELVLNGHDHDYERFAPMDPNGVVDNANGIREIVVGSGGGTQRPWAASQANSVVKYNYTYGVVKLTLHNGSYDWEFIPQAGKSDTDSGSDLCH